MYSKVPWSFQIMLHFFSFCRKSESDIWNYIISKVKTKYTYIGRNVVHFTAHERLERLVREIDDLKAYVVGSSIRTLQSGKVSKFWSGNKFQNATVHVVYTCKKNLTLDCIIFSPYLLFVSWSSLSFGQLWLIEAMLIIYILYIIWKLIRHINNIPATQSITGISRKTQSKCYMLSIDKTHKFVCFFYDAIIDWLCLRVPK